MKLKLLLMISIIFATTQVWAASVGFSDRGYHMTPVIEASVEALDFGPVEVGYPVKKQLVVTGCDLTDNINLEVKARSVNYYKVTPQTITPEQAANGATVVVTYSPGSWWWMNADLILSSEGASDVDIPITADPYYPEETFVNNQQECFTAYVGQLVTRKGTIRFADYEVPTDPTNPPVVASPAASGISMIDFGGLNGDGYSISIEGPGSAHFIARFVKTSSIANICTVKISYFPRWSGVHEATIKVYCTNAGVPLVTIPVRGEANGVLGDLDGDGIIAVGDISNMVDLLLKGGNASSQGDMDDDGMIGITDISLLVDRLLEVK